MSSDHQRQHEAAATPEHEPLPPLPDGGLGGAMPDWLRDDPADAGSSSSSAIDPASLVTADDLPEWLRQLGPERPTPVPTAATAPLPDTTATDTTATVPPPHEQPVTLAIPTSPSDDEPPLAPAPASPVPRGSAIAPAPAVAPTSTRTPMPAMHRRDPDLARRKAIVAALGFLLLVLVVAVYVYVRGGL